MLKPTENFIYSKFQITYQIITVLNTFVGSDVASIICSIGSDVKKKKSQISISNNKGTSKDPVEHHKKYLNHY